MLIAEEFLLLCWDEASGRKSIAGEKIDPALGGAVLVELALMERISVSSDDEGWIQRRRVSVVSTKPTDDVVLDDALAFVDARVGKKVQEVIHPTFGPSLTKGLRARLLQRLADRGVLSERHETVLGIFPATRWLPVDDDIEREVRSRLRAALVEGRTPTERTLALIGLLHATGHVHAALPDEDRRVVKQQARALADGDWAAKVVKSIIDDIHAAASGATG